MTATVPKHFHNFLEKSWPARLRTGQFYFRQGLAKLPFLPVPVRIQMNDSTSLTLWWSHLSPFFDPNCGYFDYWGNDGSDLRFLYRILQQGMVFLDIGANQGIYTLVAGKKLGRGGTVIAFEPSPREHGRLRRHIQMNRLSAARAEMFALGSTSERSIFFQVTSGDTQRNGFRPPSTSDSTTEISVDKITLDEYVARFSVKRLDVIKLDVEGGEIEVLRGAAGVLQTFRPILICEVLDPATLAWGYAAREIVLALLGQGYDWFDFNEDGSITPHEIRDEYPQVRNYLAVPREKREMVARDARKPAYENT